MTIPSISSLISAGVLGLMAAGAAQAHGDFKCEVPKAEWKPQMELQRKLTAEGWKVRQVKVDNGCYEMDSTAPASASKSISIPKPLRKSARSGSLPEGLQSSPADRFFKA